jgi:hypothetical protein
MSTAMLLTIHVIGSTLEPHEDFKDGRVVGLAPNISPSFFWLIAWCEKREF